jgi:hypothetical protein
VNPAAQTGFTQGHDREDWVQAESEIIRRVALKILTQAPCPLLAFRGSGRIDFALTRSEERISDQSTALSADYKCESGDSN